MSRKVHAKRVWKIIKVVVAVVSLVALIIGITNYTTFQDHQKKWLDENGRCLVKEQSSGTWRSDHSLETCGFYFSLIREQTQREIYGLSVGIGLPILFYVGKRFFDYIVPDDKKK